jgi:hypothetical protein
MMLWYKTRPLKQGQEMDPIVLLMSIGHLVDDVNIDRLMGYVDIFCYFNYYNVVLFKYLRFILHVYMFFLFAFLGLLVITKCKNLLSLVIVVLCRVF